MERIPLDDRLFVAHQEVSFTGNQCAGIAMTLEAMMKGGCTAEKNPEFATLLQIFCFILEFMKANQQRQKMITDNSRLPEYFTKRQFFFLLLQIEALKHLQSDKKEEQRLPTALSTALQAISHESTWERAPKQEQLLEAALQVSPLPALEASTPCAALSAVLNSRHKPRLLAPDFLQEQRERLLAVEMDERLRQLQAALPSPFAPGKLHSRSINKVIPVITKEFRLLQLHEMQYKLREAVRSAMPAKVIAGGVYRTPKEIDNQQKQRDRNMKKANKQAEKDKKKRQKDFLAAVFEHYKVFQKFQSQQVKGAKKVAELVKKALDDRVKHKQAASNEQERARMRMLKSNNEAEYFRLVKEQKNERLQSLLHDTDEYMKSLAGKLKHLNQSHDQPESVPTEDSTLIEPEATDEKKIDMDKLLTNRQMYKNIGHERKETISKQPEMMKAAPLRSYQLAGLNWLASLYNNNLNGILADEMGLGKTVQTLALLAWLMEARQNQGPFLIIVPMSTLNNNWEYEINRWMPNVQKILYHGARDRRREIRETQLNGGNYNILLTTYEFAMRDKKFLNKIAWQYIIVDEAHRLKNPKCKLATELVTYNQKSRRVALTGTPLQNDLPELWALLNFLHPSIFDNVSSFEKWFANPLGDALGLNKKDNEENIQMTEEEKLLVADRLHQVLRPFMLRREKSQVECDLQDKLEVVLRCDLTKTQEIFYECLMTQRVHMANQMVQLRKVCNHPFLFHPYMRNVPGSFLYDNEMLVKLSGKFALLDRVLPKLKATNHRVLIFNQMTKVMNILEHYMNHRGYSFVRLDGSTAAAERQERLTQFNTNRSIFVFMLSTKAGGLGLNLQTADTVILFDSDWNPQNDLQAEARAHRIGQKEQVLVLRLITSSTVEEKILSTAANKMTQEALVIQAGMFHDKYKAHEARELLENVFREKKIKKGKKATKDREISALLARSEQEKKIFLEMDAKNASNIVDLGYREDIKKKRKETKTKRDEDEEEEDDDDDDDDDDEEEEEEEEEEVQDPKNPHMKISFKDRRYTLQNDKVPSWILDWVMSGQKAKSCDETIVDFNESIMDKNLDCGFTVPSFKTDANGKTVRASRTTVESYNADVMFDAMENEVSSDDDDEKVVANATPANRKGSFKEKKSTGIRKRPAPSSDGPIEGSESSGKKPAAKKVKEEGMVSKMEAPKPRIVIRRTLAKDMESARTPVKAEQKVSVAKNVVASAVAKRKREAAKGTKPEPGSSSSSSSEATESDSGSGSDKSSESDSDSSDDDNIDVKSKAGAKQSPVSKKRKIS